MELQAAELCALAGVNALEGVSHQPSALAQTACTGFLHLDALAHSFQMHSLLSFMLQCHNSQHVTQQSSTITTDPTPGHDYQHGEKATARRGSQSELEVPFGKWGH